MATLQAVERGKELLVDYGPDYWSVHRILDAHIWRPLDELQKQRQQEGQWLLEKAERAHKRVRQEEASNLKLAKQVSELQQQLAETQEQLAETKRNSLSYREQRSNASSRARCQYEWWKTIEILCLYCCLYCNYCFMLQAYAITASCCRLRRMLCVQVARWHDVPDRCANTMRTCGADASARTSRACAARARRPALAAGSGTGNDGSRGIRDRGMRKW
eukprot:4906909-Prymnesium_polylepis.1